MRFLLLLMIFVSSFAYQQAKAQEFPLNFCKDDFLGVKKFYLNDSISIPCDTVFVMNKNTFKVYDNLAKSFNDPTKECKDLLIGQRELYEGRIQMLESDYDKLKVSYNSIYDKSLEFNESAKTRLLSINTSLDSADVQLKQISQNLAETQKMLKKERWNLFGRKILWGLGGIGVGVVVGTAISN